MAHPGGSGQKQAAEAAGTTGDDGGEEQVRVSLCRHRDLAPRAPWSPDDGQGLASVATAGGRQRCAELPALLADLAAGGLAPLEDLCVTLRDGGYQVAEGICDGGAIELALERLTTPAAACQDAVAVSERARPLAAEALWLMLYDHESCTRFMQAGGHRRIVKLLREEAPSCNSALSSGALRVIGETLYSEPRSAEIWGTAELDFIIEAMDWALRFEPASERGPLLAIVCNLAALWVWRAKETAVETILPLVGLVPRLLEELSVRNEEPDVLAQGCRLLHGLAGRCRFWPENVREPTIAAMQEMSSNYRFTPLPGVQGYSIQALKAVQELPAAPPTASGALSSMD